LLPAGQKDSGLQKEKASFPKMQKSRLTGRDFCNKKRGEEKMKKRK